MRFGDILRELLEEREISQKQFAQDLSLAASTVGNYIRNLREPDYETLKRIAAYFSVSLDYLLDHHPQKGASAHQEDRLLQIYHRLPPEQQRLFLAQGELLLKYSAGPGKGPSSR